MLYITEIGSCKPGADLMTALAQMPNGIQQTLDVLNIDSRIGLMHTKSTLEDVYGLIISEADGEVCTKDNKN